MASKRLPNPLALSKAISVVRRCPNSRRPQTPLPSSCVQSLSTTSTVVDTNPFTFPESLLNSPAIDSNPTAQPTPSHHPSDQPSTASAQPAPARSPPLDNHHRKASSPSSSIRYSPTRLPLPPANTPPSTTSPLTPSLRLTLPHLAAQPPFYATIHIHGKPYLVTAGDTIRLPFLMHGVVPGDILRLNRAIVLGSRDWTLLGGGSSSSAHTSTSTSKPTSTSSPSDLVLPSPAEPVVGRTDGLIPTNTTTTAAAASPKKKQLQKGPMYIDDRLFTCRALVLGTESEPMRIKHKKKQRNRRLKKVQSKHRYTMLKIRELVVRGVEEIESGEERVAASAAGDVCDW